MSNPFTPVTEAAAEDRDYIPMARCKGKLLVVRPLDYQREGFTTKHKPDGTDVIFADIALLDPINTWVDEDDVEHQGFPADHQFRNQAVLQGYLKGTFKRYIGSTLIGTLYNGVATKGKPPMMWQDLSGDLSCVSRGQRFLAAHPEFLIPVTANIVTSEPETGFHGYRPPQEAPAAAAASPGYRTGDPWAQNGSQPVPPAPATRPMTTLEQMRNMGNSPAGHQPSDAPF